MTILALDGNSILNRAFYGIRPLTTSTGINTNAVYGFLTILLRHMQKHAPCKIFVAFDRREKTFRHKMYDGYKAGRKGMPEELAEQLPIIKEILKAMGILCVEKAGIEADDIIGIICKHSPEDCIIITGDRDSFQLIDDTTTVKLATTGADEVYDAARINEKYGLAPSELIDLKALMGDSSDNIPGVPGVGEKTALTLLHKYKTLDGIYEHTDELKGALKDRMINGKESAFMSRKLGQINTDAELDISIDEICEPKFNNELLTKFFNKYELISLLKRFNIETCEDEKSSEISLEITDDFRPGLFNQNTLYLLYFDGFIYIKNGNKTVKIIADKETLSLLKNTPIVTHDAKPLIKALLDFGYTMNLKYDTLLAAYVIDPSKPSYPLAALASLYAHANATEDGAYASILDIIEAKTMAEIQKNMQTQLYNEIELPLCTVLADMEHAGFELDVDFLHDFGKRLDIQLTELTNEVYSFSGREFNINSPKQIGTILFEEMCFPVIKKTKTGYSTDNDVLEKLLYKTEHPIIQNIIDYRKLAKLRSTYVDGLLNKVGKDKRIHTLFTQTVTQTGRISSIEPNLQNIPVRTELGKNLRRVFVAKEGYVLIDADYSQIELRVLAHIANDKLMQEAFIQNKDIHTITASQVFNMPENMITEELRRRAKAVNFGIVYGIGEYSLSQDIHVSMKDAKNYIAEYLKTYSGVRSYMENTVSFAKENGYVQTLFNRRRYVPDINAKNKQLQAFSARVCMNTPIQGTAADIIKLAMVRVYEKLNALNIQAKIILQVHDELILEVLEAEKEKVAEILKHEMEHAVELSVPLIADVGYGKTWFDAKL